MPLAIKVYCQRRLDGIRCKNEAQGFCKDHINIMCTKCGKKTSTFECRTCSKPLCTTCQCHNSFGH